MSLASGEYLKTHCQQLQQQAQTAQWLIRSAERQPGAGRRLLAASGDRLIALGECLKQVSHLQVMTSPANDQKTHFRQTPHWGFTSPGYDHTREPFG